ANDSRSMRAEPPATPARTRSLPRDTFFVLCYAPSDEAPTPCRFAFAGPFAGRRDGVVRRRRGAGPDNERARAGPADVTARGDDRGLARRQRVGAGASALAEVLRGASQAIPSKPGLLRSLPARQRRPACGGGDPLSQRRRSVAPLRSRSADK